MASGLVTGFQHQLLNEEELTKERFAELCEEWFYHLRHYDMKSLEELEAFRREELAGYQEKIQHYTSRLTVLKTASDDDLQEEYDEYVVNAHKANAHYRKKHKEEVERLALVREYAEAFRPHLEYVWKDLEDPELFQVDVFDFQEWRASQLHTAEHSLKFYTDLKASAGAHDDMNTEAGRVVDDFERRKVAFLSNE